MKRTVVHLVRHGEVENPARIIYGRLPDYHLSTLGVRMAEEAAKYLAGRDVVALRSSPLERARETSEPIAAEFGLSVVPDSRLIEPANSFEGKRFGFGKGEALRSPAALLRLYNPIRPSWGEPYTAIADRMRAVVTDVRAQARGHEAVCVSHQLAIWTARMSLLGNRLWHDPRSRICALASVTSLVYDGDVLSRIDYHEPAADLAAVTEPEDVPGA
jgi:broad specificity phosphatase PhoE